MIDEDQLDDLEEHELQKEGEATSVFMYRGEVAEWQFSKKRVTSMKEVKPNKLRIEGV